MIRYFQPGAKIAVFMDVIAKVTLGIPFINHLPHAFDDGRCSNRLPEVDEVPCDMPAHLATLTGPRVRYLTDVNSVMTKELETIEFFCLVRCSSFLEGQFTHHGQRAQHYICSVSATDSKDPKKRISIEGKSEDVRKLLDRDTKQTRMV